LKGEKVYRAVEQQPEFPGGLGELMAYLSTHIRYPQKARDFNAQGKVYVRFVVTADGCIDRVSVEKDEISTAFQVATELESLEKYIVYYERHVEECEREIESLKPVLERLKKEYGSLENDGAEPAVLERKKDEIQVLTSGISSLEGALKYWRTELDGVRTHFEKSRNALEEVTVVSYKNGKSGDYSPDKQYELNKAAIQSLRDESVRVVKSMPKWNPGKQGGKNVNVEMTLPITFRLR
jgi:DNA repair exonuclease SbcCD ATPase subunit